MQVKIVVVKFLQTLERQRVVLGSPFVRERHVTSTCTRQHRTLWKYKLSTRTTVGMNQHILLLLFKVSFVRCLGYSIYKGIFSINTFGMFCSDHILWCYQQFNVLQYLPCGHIIFTWIWFCSTAFGCPNPDPPIDGFVNREGNRAIITCESTMAQWEIECHDGQWHGQLGDCAKSKHMPYIY